MSENPKPRYITECHNEQTGTKIRVDYMMNGQTQAAPYAASCLSHGEWITSDRLKQIMHLSLHPVQWCDGCAEMAMLERHLGTHLTECDLCGGFAHLREQNDGSVEIVCLNSRAEECGYKVQYP